MVRAVPDHFTAISPAYVATTIEKQTVEFNIQARVNFKSRCRARMGIWEAMEMLNTLVDESDPDVSPCDIDLTRTLLMRLCSLLHRPACHRSNICSKPLRRFVAMANPSGCK
jgi:hypothetical protein